MIEEPVQTAEVPNRPQQPQPAPGVRRNPGGLQVHRHIPLLDRQLPFQQRSALDGGLLPVGGEGRVP
ncbi:hypothetical protein OG824_12540 [Streptomyces prunicolor]|uniref:hypothetical protein n=1 Tax=Streptomyces prunicolor TaxID=67348 RepID=UPI0022537ABA|nr:hypothetical protein [Streptomyces prunicolor]MCX5236029.1 hypothetical protein [Streptomyces prunicolor]